MAERKESRFILACAALLLCAHALAATPALEGANLVANPDFSTRQPGKDAPNEYGLYGNVTYRFLGDKSADFSSMGVALNSGPVKSGGELSGAVAYTVKRLDSVGSRWYRFSVRGMAQEDFAVKTATDLSLMVEFFADNCNKAVGSTFRNIYALVEKDRKDLAANGTPRNSGSAVWRTYQFDFKLPVPECDAARVSVRFARGCAKNSDNSAFFVSEFSVVQIPEPLASNSAQVALKIPSGPQPLGTLIPLGGNWFFDARDGEKEAPKEFDASNVSRLFFKTETWETPFVGNASAWMRAGYKDFLGRVLTEDRFVPDNVKITFTDTHLILHSKNLPNHPTAKYPEDSRILGPFPGPPPAGGFNGLGPIPHYIQELDQRYYLLLNPATNLSHEAMNSSNSNHALPGGPIGIAVNGVVFYNPYDAEVIDSSNAGDRCCGHPGPEGRYHYHRFPACMSLSKADEGAGHSPLIGWALDGFAIYGPYESSGVLAKDVKGEQALNEFNVHYDKYRGWHYHVTPGKYPYVIGGYWGTEDLRNRERRPDLQGMQGANIPGAPNGQGPGGQGPGGFRPPRPQFPPQPGSAGPPGPELK